MLDPLQARALVLKSGAVKIAIVSLDLGRPPTARALRESARRSRRMGSRKSSLSHRTRIMARSWNWTRGPAPTNPTRANWKPSSSPSSPRPTPPAFPRGTPKRDRGNRPQPQPAVETRRCARRQRTPGAALRGPEGQADRTRRELRMHPTMLPAEAPEVLRRLSRRDGESGRSQDRRSLPVLAGCCGRPVDAFS